jgi:acyl-coenzyme A synthetase/AMP-(fatty) acid ligase
MVKDPAMVENLRKLRQVTFGGGPLPQAVGDVISSKTKLLNCLGTTECGVLPVQLCDPEDWAYMRVSPVFGHEYRHAFDGFYEQVIVRNPKYQRYQGIFGTFPSLNEWPMKDLYTKHPTKDNVWLYQGRTDDILILSTGDKLSPVDMESIIEANAAIGAALVTGFGRFKCALLVEAVNPPSKEEEKERLLDTIWPSVKEANKKAPSSAQIHREMIILTSKDKPMLRAGKGTVQRKMTVTSYAKELDALYA